MSMNAQDWQWKWGAPTDKSFRYTNGIQSLGTDYANRFCVAYSYNDSLFLHDTVFGHNTTNPYTSNVALALYRNDGTFLRAIDLFSNANGNIWQTYSRTDSSGNMYIACEFQVRAFLNGAIINHGPGPYTETPDIFIAKLGTDMVVEWVKVIWGSTQATLAGFEVGNDQQIYLATSHYGNGGASEYVNYFGADSTYYHSTIYSILKINPQGNLLWRKEIGTENVSANFLRFVTGQDGKIYHVSTTAGAYHIGPDTVLVPPGHPQNTQFLCLLSFNTDGDFLHGQMIDNRLNITDLKVDQAGEMYFSGIYWDTAYVANDTLVAGPDSTGSLLGKTDSNFNVLWYQDVKAKASLGTPVFHIVPDAGDLYFAATFIRTFQFAGQTFHFGNSRKPLIGKLLPGGILENFTVGQSSSDMYAYDLTADNCRNLLLTGMFTGKAFLGKDTLHGYLQSEFIGFLQVHPPPDPGLGNDTAVCRQLVLHAAPGLSYYSWNNGISTTDSIVVSATGWYSVTMHNENYCWATDSVFVTVTTPPEKLLGSDTSIYRRDSLMLKVTVPYDRCLWSTGDTTASVYLHGADLGVGDHTIFVSIDTGPCEVADSIHIAVTWSPGLEDQAGETCKFYPNPFRDNISILLPQGSNQVSISGPDGKQLLTFSFNNQTSQYHEIGLSSLPGGMFFLQVVSGQKVYVGKLVKQ